MHLWGASAWEMILVLLAAIVQKILSEKHTNKRVIKLESEKKNKQH